MRHGRWLHTLWVAWLIAVGGWLMNAWQQSKIPPDWPRDPIAWWTGDDHRHLPTLPMESTLHDGAMIHVDQGDPAYEIQRGGAVSFGRYTNRRRPMTWSFHLLAGKTTQEPEIEVASISGPLYHTSISMKGDQLQLRMHSRPETLENQGSKTWSLEADILAAAARGVWHKVTLVSSLSHVRWYVDGKQVWAGEPVGLRYPEYVDLVLSMGPNARRAWNREWTTDEAAEAVKKLQQMEPNFVVRFDDVAVWDCALEDKEVKSLHAVERGGLRHLVTASERLDRVLQLGWPWAAGTFLLLSLLTLAPLSFGFTLSTMPWRQAVPVGMLLMIGLTATTALSWLLFRAAIRSDRDRFTEQLTALSESLDTFFEKAAAAAGRVRDRAETYPQGRSEDWIAWATQSHLLHDLGVGLIGLGYAHRVAPLDIPELETRMSKELGIEYRVHPDRSSGSNRLLLTGEPRLPVVMYISAEVPRVSILGPETVLGRDMLVAGPDLDQVEPEPSRIESAVRTGALISSGLERIAPASWFGTPTDGLRLYCPITKSEFSNNSTNSVSPSQWSGVAFADLDIRRWVRTYLESSNDSLGFQIFTGSESIGRYEKILSTGDWNSNLAWRPDAQFTHELKVKHYHYRLFVDAWSTPAFEARSQRRWAWATSIAGSGFTLLAAGMLLSQIRARERERLAAENLSKLQAKLDVSRADRERVSRELHDRTIQNLYALGLLLKRSANQSKEYASTAQGMIQETIAELRAFLGAPAEEVATTKPLTEIVASLEEALSTAARVRFNTSIAPEADSFEPTLSAQVAAVLRESISNAIRHGKAQTIQISLTQPMKNHWRLLIEDDGHGFDLDGKPQNGRGLASMQSRAIEIGGTFECFSSPGSGTRISLRFCTPSEPTSATG